jgi:hypothetical protein
MAKQEKDRLVFSPQRIAFRIAKNKSKEEQKIYFRNASNAYIKNPAVRKYILKEIIIPANSAEAKKSSDRPHCPVYLATKETYFR